MNLEKISVCIPSFNRPSPLAELLESVVSQDYQDFEIVVCEDRSPARNQIREVVQRVQEAHPERSVQYFENEQNLGYDGNLRHLIELAQGEYCLFMGDDDLMYPGALKQIGVVLENFPNLGAINRSYRITERSTGRVLSESRYFHEDRFFPSGLDSAVSFFRRFVFISGLVVHRESSLALATNRFDGTLLYQIYLIGNLALDMNSYFIADFLTQNCKGEDHYFGSSQTEQGRFAPHTLTPQHSLNFMQGMLDIARWIDESRQVRFYDRVVADLASYAYPFLVVQAQNKRVFWKYARDLGKLGFGRYPIFWFYVLLLLVFNISFLHRVQVFIKSLYKHTPIIGNVYRGISVEEAHHR